ncbi:hypothetical protein LCGC14_1971690, partial [marine sediment metagenome]
MEPPALDPVNAVPLHDRPGIVDPPDRYGHFDEHTGEYVITRPDTPQPWHNYITNGSFTGYVSHTGGGTCYGLNDPVEKRILRTHLHGRPADQPGRWTISWTIEARFGVRWSGPASPTLVHAAGAHEERAREIVGPGCVADDRTRAVRRHPV